MITGTLESWTFDLVARDDIIRGRALARHAQLTSAAGDALRRDDHRAYAKHQKRTVFGALDEFTRGGPMIRDAHAPVALLYLVWEHRYPDEWRTAGLWSPWTAKEVVLRSMGRHGVPEGIRSQLANLIIDVLARTYRCKDWRYATLIRHVPLPEDRLTPLLDADDPVVRQRAHFAQHVAAHPDERVTRNSWARWLADR